MNRRRGLPARIDRGFLALLSALAEDESERIHKRASDGRAAAKHRGVTMGRRPKLSVHQQSAARARLARGESSRAVAADMAVHHSTIARLR